MARVPSPRLGLGPFSPALRTAYAKGLSLWPFMAGSAANSIAWAAPWPTEGRSVRSHNQKFHEFMNAT